MIVYHKSAPLTSSLLPLPLPSFLPRHTACALEGTLNTRNKCLMVTCYLPQDNADHSKACSVLTTLPLLYPDHLIILGGDFQGDLTSPSDKSCQLRTLPSEDQPYPPTLQQTTLKRLRVLTTSLYTTPTAQPPKHKTPKILLTRFLTTTESKQQYAPP